MVSFLFGHFTRYMDSTPARVGVEDISIDLQGADEETRAGAYGALNDLDPETTQDLLRRYRELRTKIPPPVPSNIVLGEG